MASSWFLVIMPFKFLHHVAWPLLALVYPMCASVQAIETDSYEETKHLISYWILLSLIYLFEYAFMSLLPWFQLWMYIKLVFIIWLTTPDFGRASYVYNNLIRSMKLQIVTWRLNNNYWRKWFFDKDNFLMHAERYMKENGTEALEKLIASKNTMCRPDAEVTNEIIVTDNKEMLKTNGERLQLEQKDIKNLDAIEKQDILVTKQDFPVMPIIEPSPQASSATVETKGTEDSDIAGGEVPQSSISTKKEVQKEWTCALCLVTAPSESVWNSHLSGKKHRALQKQKDAEVRNEIIATGNKEMLKTNGERLQTEHKDIKDFEAVEKKEIHETKQDIPVMPILEPSPQALSATVETKGTEDSDIAGGEVPQSSTSTKKEVQKEWTCALCLVTALSESIWNSHLSGKKHRASLQKQKDAETNGERLQTEHKDVKDFEAVGKKEIHETKQDIPVMPKIEPSQNASLDSATVETKGTAESDKTGGEVPQSSASTQKEVQKQWTCDLCLLTITCEKSMTMHLNGKRHRTALQKQKDAEVKNQPIATDNKEILETNGERLQTEHKDIKDLEAIEKKDTPSTKQDILIMPKIGPSQTASSATVETKGRAESDTVGGEVPQSSTSTLKEVQKEWTCALCLFTTTSENLLNSHFNGRKHKAACEAALKAKKQPAPQKLQIYLPKVEVKQKNFSDMLNSNVKNGDGIVNKGLKGTVVMDHKVQKPQNFNFHIIGATPSTQAVRGPTPFGRPMSSPPGFPFPYHSGTTPFRGPTPSPISVPFPYYGPEGSWSRQPEFPYFIPTPRLPHQNPNCL
ncbi:unnamed protein product [Trifolium pratense]|uniref:Uncharacterized protein n=1 Tax=Trifolium pratense TaxID=57577 RepID=A0ACB0MBP2_TRIPR|nr:unnamed protein product [Trifolium pratense]